MLKRVDILKKAAIILSFCLISFSVFADNGNGGDSNISLFQFIQNVLTEDLQPLVAITITVAYFIGLCLIILGITRLYRHGEGAQSMMYRVSPMGTGMYFFAGFTLIALMSQLQMLSNSLYPLNPESALITQCTNGPILNSSNFQTSSNSFCPMQAYDTDVQQIATETPNSVGIAIKYLIFGVLFLVGMISFVRGVVQLIKIGEGGGQGQTVGRALTHIFAGIVAVNPDLFYGLMQNILINNTSSS